MGVVLQGLEHYSRDEVDSTLAAQQHELRVTQQAFHAKQVQLEGQQPFASTKSFLTRCPCSLTGLCSS